MLDLSVKLANRHHTWLISTSRQSAPIDLKQIL